MALVLKTGKTYTTKYGEARTEIYAVIDRTWQNKTNEVAYYELDIYANQTARQNQDIPLETYRYEVSNDKFIGKFDSNGLNPLDKNPYKNAYDDIILIENVDEDGDPIEGDYVWKDLESDE